MAGKNLFSIWAPLEVSCIVNSRVLYKSGNVFIGIDDLFSLSHL